MEAATVISFLQESLFFIVIFGAFLSYALVRSLQSLINLILGLYLALLISIEFPYYTIFTQGADARTESILMILIFMIFTFFSTLMFSRLMIGGSDEPPFSQFSKKVMFAIAATILCMIFSYHVLPVTELLQPGSPIQNLFAPEQNFFWWLLIPLVLLFLI